MANRSSIPQSSNDILERIVIAIDGPSGSGKTTTARGVAQRLGLRHIDTGAMYRSVTYKVLRSGVAPDDADAVGRIADHADIRFIEAAGAPQRVILDGENVTADIRSAEVTGQVSLVSSHRQVRKSMVRRQRALADDGGVVLEGRDIGSVVLPGAHVKVYLDADVDVRATRRMEELAGTGGKSLNDVRADLEARDERDRQRELSPLKIPIGASIIDTSDLTIDGQIDAVVAMAKERAQQVFSLIRGRLENDPARKRRVHFIMVQWMARWLARLLFGLRVVRKDPLHYGEHHIFASNHRSNIDPPLVGSNVRENIHFVAKAALFKIPILGPFISTLNAFPIQRGRFDRAAMDRCLQILDGRNSVLIFPEGGRVLGDVLGRSKAGVGYLALQSGVPVIPIYIHGSNRLRQALFRSPRVTVIFGQPIHLTDGDLARHQNPDDYREFGAMVMAAIEALKDEHESPTG
jgi:cytidylate kinase